MTYQEILERLSKLYELRDLIVAGRSKGFLERDEALRLVKLLRGIVLELSGGEAKLTLHLIDVAEEFIRSPGPLVRNIALEKFDREDVLPMPEHLVDALPEPPLLEFLKLLTSGPLGRVLLETMVQRIGLSTPVLEALFNVSLRDLVSELGYLFEALLDTAKSYAEVLERYIVGHGVGELRLSRETLSAFAEVTARAWLSTVLRGVWAQAEPIARQARKAQYEFDAVAIERVKDTVEVHVAEIELRCSNFLKPEERRSGITRVEGKIGRLRHLLNTIANAYRSLGMRRTCLAELLLICLDNPSPEERKLLLSEIRSSLEILRSKHRGEALCTSFDINRNVKLVTGSDMLQSLSPRPPLHRLREAIEYIVETVSKPQVNIGCYQ